MIIVKGGHYIDISADKYDIVCIQEAHITNKPADPWQSNGLDFSFLQAAPMEKVRSLQMKLHT